MSKNRFKQSDYERMFSNLPFNEELATKRLQKEFERHNLTSDQLRGALERSDSIIRISPGIWMRTHTNGKQISKPKRAIRPNRSESLTEKVIKILGLPVYSNTLRKVTLILAVVALLSSCDKERLSLESCRWVVADSSFYTRSMNYYNDSLEGYEVIECISLHIETDTNYLRCVKYYTDSTHSYTTCKNWKNLTYETIN